MDVSYGTDVKGLCGNEVCGQMSAWYILSAAGLHPVDPTSGIYLIGSPLFDKVTTRLDPQYHTGKELVVEAKNNSSKNIYVQSVQLNGKPLIRLWVSYEELTQGGTLSFVMGATPNKTLANTPAMYPQSLSEPIQ